MVEGSGKLAALQDLVAADFHPLVGQVFTLEIPQTEAPTSLLLVEVTEHTNKTPTRQQFSILFSSDQQFGSGTAQLAHAELGSGPVYIGPVFVPDHDGNFYECVFG